VRSKALWQEWLHHHETPNLQRNLKIQPSATERKGAFFSHEMLAYQAAVQGQGIALANRPLIEKELAEQSLVIALNKPLIVGRSYYLLWSTKAARQNNRSIEMFRQWIIDSLTE
jgi:DNA-binding transcriptional LysR family regulator